MTRNTISSKMENIPSSVEKICVQTGNILSINEIMKKVGQTPTEEVRLTRVYYLVNRS